MKKKKKETKNQHNPDLRSLKKTMKKAELKITRRPSPCVYVDCVCREAREGRRVVAHSVAVAHERCGRVAHENIISFIFFNEATQVSPTWNADISEPAGLCSLPDLPCRQSYLDIQKNQRAI